MGNHFIGIFKLFLKIQIVPNRIGTAPDITPGLFLLNSIFIVAHVWEYKSE